MYRRRINITQHNVSKEIPLKTTINTTINCLEIAEIKKRKLVVTSADEDAEQT